MKKISISITLLILASLSGCILLFKPFYSNQLRNHFMLNVKNEFLIGQTEVTVKNWLDFMFFSDLQEYPSFIQMKDLSEKEIETLLLMTFDKSLLPVEPKIKNFISQLINIDNEELVAIKFKPDIGSNIYVPIPKNSAKNKKYKEHIRRLLNNPITGISYEQAINYCNWRTELDSIRMYDLDYEFKGRKIIYENYKYELPSPEVYDELLSQKDSITDDLNHSTFNYKNAFPPFKKYDKNELGEYGKELVRIASSSQYPDSSTSKMILFDLRGNAAEMTNVKGIAKGGSYAHYAYQGYPGYDIRYNEPEEWLGFRCIGRRSPSSIQYPERTHSQPRVMMINELTVAPGILYQSLVPEIVYDVDSSLLLKIKDNDDGEVIASGKLSSANPIVKDGRFTFFTPSGQPYAVGYYQNDIPYRAWSFFDEAGKVIKTINYNSTFQYISKYSNIDIGNDFVFLADVLPKWEHGSIHEYLSSLEKQAIYPPLSLMIGEEGRVICQFTIDKEGKIINPTIIRGVSTDLNTEVLRLLCLPSNWIPATIDGQPENYVVTLPIKFGLDKE